MKEVDYLTSEKRRSGKKMAMWAALGPRVFMFNGAFNTEVLVGDNEPTDSALRRFRKSVLQAGVLPEVRRRRYFEDTQDIKKRKASTRFKKVYKPKPTADSNESVKMGGFKAQPTLSASTPAAPAP